MDSTQIRPYSVVTLITTTLLNMKGGVGKTTLAVNLAWHMKRMHKARVLLVDLDPQFNASQSVMTYDAWEAHRKKAGTVANVLLDADRPRMQLKPKAGAKTLASRLYHVERGLALLPSELELAHAIKNPQGIEYRLQKALETVDADFDYAFIDSSPTDTVLTAAALMASDFVLVPMRPDRFSILGYEMIESVLEDFREGYPNPKKVQNLGVVFTFVEKTPGKIESKCKTKVRQAAQGSYIFKSELAMSRSYLRAVDESLPISDTRYARKATKESMKALTLEFGNRVRAARAPLSR